jgi:hypothetical protein
VRGGATMSEIGLKVVVEVFDLASETACESGG